MSGLEYILMFALGILLVPFVAYLWGRSQAAGWIEAFKKSNLTFNKKNNGQTKKEQEKEV